MGIEFLDADFTDKMDSLRNLRKDAVIYVPPALSWQVEPVETLSKGPCPKRTQL